MSEKLLSVWVWGAAVSMRRRRRFACVSSGEGKVRDVRAVLRAWLPWLWPCAGCWVPEVGAGPGPRGRGVMTEQKIPQSSLPGATGTRLSYPQAGRLRRKPRCVCALHLSTAKPLGIYLSLSVSRCARLCLCAHCWLCVCACLCLCMYLGLCLGACSCWSMLVCMTVSGSVCV